MFNKVNPIKAFKAIKKIIIDAIHANQYILIVPEYKAAHYAWTLHGINDWINCYNNCDYLVFSPYHSEPIRGEVYSGGKFINGL